MVVGVVNFFFFGLLEARSLLRRGLRSGVWGHESLPFWAHFKTWWLEAVEVFFSGLLEGRTALSCLRGEEQKPSSSKYLGCSGDSKSNHVWQRHSVVTLMGSGEVILAAFQAHLCYACIH